MGKWFIFENNEVQGPFDTNSVEKKIESGSLGNDCLIWGQPQNDWKSPTWWRNHLHELLTQHPTSQKEKQWHFVVDEVSSGPLSREDFLKQIQEIENKKDILIWTTGMEDWLPLFEFEDLLNEIGISKRKHSRTNIQGQAIVEFNGQSYIGQLKTVSAGGCGISGINNLSIGSEVNLILKSNAFHQELRAKAEVRFISETGFIGFMFQAINSEDKATIINYIRSQLLQNKNAA
ncbi:MAG: DUF4339 domain-containing protein [Bdellovibrionaceae bacterium]|nr:DUF4339 domain-containing protein [Pseudobdellovibrionaceae bacterium]